MLGVLGIFKAKGTQLFNEIVSRPSEVVGGSLTSVLPIKCALKSQIYGPFLLNMALPFILLAIAGLLLIPKTLGEMLIRQRRKGREVPTWKGKWRLPRRVAVLTWLREPMDKQDIALWHDKFHPKQRLAGVAVFILFTVYPTLVASIASLYNCTTQINGYEYLVVDLTVTCYEGMHLLFLAFASVGALVYAIGIPITIAFVTAMKSPCGHNEEGKVVCVCARRSAAKYKTYDVRARFAFLFNGYATDRSGVVVAWEAIVMMRKLAVTLAASLIKDPYLQILAALMILVVSFGATAYVQPYEMMSLNLLETLGLFALIVTQIVSIVYFYVAQSSTVFGNRRTIEVTITALLLTANVLMILIYLTFVSIEMLRLRKRCKEKRSMMYKIAGATQTQAALVASLAVPDVRRSRRHRRVTRSERMTALAAPVASGSLWWHPDGVAVATPPTRSDNSVWIYTDAVVGVAASWEEPVLLLPINSTHALRAGDLFCWVEITTKDISAKERKPPYFGGRSGCCGAHNEEGGIVSEGDVEMSALTRTYTNARLRAQSETLRASLSANNDAGIRLSSEDTQRQLAAAQDTIDRLSVENDQLHEQHQRDSAINFLTMAEFPQVERRIADDGNPYPREEFIAHYGGTREWDAAEVAEVDDDEGEHVVTVAFDANETRRPPLRRSKRCVLDFDDDDMQSSLSNSDDDEEEEEEVLPYDLQSSAEVEDDEGAAFDANETRRPPLLRSKRWVLDFDDDARQSSLSNGLDDDEEEEVLMYDLSSLRRDSVFEIPSSEEEPTHLVNAEGDVTVGDWHTNEHC